MEYTAKNALTKLINDTFFDFKKAIPLFLGISSVLDMSNEV
jgi:hypothetical protein